jgi:hypothetical protein
MDWTALWKTAETGGVDVEALKAELPIAFVMERAGHPIAEYDGTAAHALCPFHPDGTPSFDIYGEHLERFGCFPCGAGGDVLDLIGMFWPQLTGFKDRVAAAQQLIGEKHAAGWTGPTTGVKKEFDFTAARALVEAARARQPQDTVTIVRHFIDSKVSKSPGLADVTPEWLVGTFRLGSHGVEVVIPYYNRDGELVSYKHRTAETKALSPAGGNQFDDVLYGEWMDDGERPVLLCEGESDVWVATAALPGFTVVGLPTGAGAHPKQAARLAGRRVVVALDGDRAGRASTVKWYGALVEQGCEVQLAPVPDDCDLASLSGTSIRDIVSRARAVPTPPTGLNETPQGYVRPGKETNTPIANWTFDPTRELTGKGASAYEGRILPGGEPAVLSSIDLSSKARIVGWSARHGGSWYGADRDAQLLLGKLQAQGPFLAPGRMATTAGLHEGQFIWPGGRIGDDYWVYVPPATDVHLESRMDLKDGRPWDPGQVAILRELHDHRVTDPFLSWLAVAPLRSMLREFPILAVTGGSGSGKTTLVETLVKHFSGTLITNNLTATTRHSIFAFIGSTNAFPVWFDEYRPGARKDAIETLNQLLRDAYTGQASSKGGMGESWAEVTSVSTLAPIIVSGEDAFVETSHTERMVLLALPVQGKRPDTLARVKGWDAHSFAHTYLSWLHEGFEAGWLPDIVNYETGPEDLPGRQRQNLGVLELGWALLQSFCFQLGGIELGEPDYSLVIEEGREASNHNPIKDCILWALDETGIEETVFRDHDDNVHVRPDNLVALAERFNFPLPGGSKAIGAYLRANFGAWESEYTAYGKTRRSLAFPHDALTS